MGIKVGDRVRLVGWEGVCEGIEMHRLMSKDVGRMATVVAMPSDLACSRGARVVIKGTLWWWWPVSKLEPV